MTRLVISPLALHYLRGIWTYTEAKWDERQAELYVRSIHTAMDRITNTPRLGSKAGDTRPDYRKYPVGSHVVFFKRKKDEVIIIRVLHESMDFKRHFK